MGVILRFEPDMPVVTGDVAPWPNAPNGGKWPYNTSANISVIWRQGMLSVLQIFLFFRALLREGGDQRRIWLDLCCQGFIALNHIL